jgi:tetratricopeptide (TPR) repeat protein
MNPDPNHQNQPRPDGSFSPDFMEKFQEVIKSYAEAINSDQAEEADRAAVALLAVAAAEAKAHPTLALQLGAEADNFLRAGDWVRSEDAYRKLMTLQEQTGNAGLLAKPQMDLSGLFCLIGRWDEAWSLARAATASARRTGLSPLIAMALRNEALCALARSDAPQALAAASEAVQVIEPGKIADLMRAQACTLRAQCLLANGDSDAAEKDLKAAWDILGSRRPSSLATGPVVALAKWCEVQAQLLVGKGNHQDAASALQRAIEHRREGLNRSCGPSPHAFAALARDFEALAEILNKTGDLQAKQQALAEAQGIWERIHLPASGPKTTAPEQSAPSKHCQDGGAVPGLAQPGSGP